MNDVSSNRMIEKGDFRIAYAEDTDDCAFLVSRVLIKAGFRAPDRFAHGGQMIRHLSTTILQELPDVILLDLHMPVKNGFEVLQWTRTHAPCHTIPVIMLTSSEEESDREKAASLGAMNFLRKDGLFRSVIEALEEIRTTAPSRPSFRQSIPAIRDGMDPLLKEIAVMAEHKGERVVLTDTEGRIEWVSSEFAHRHGGTLQDWHGRKPETILDGADDQEESVRRMRQAVEGEGPCACEILKHRDDGTAAPVTVSIGPVLGEDGRQRFIALERDGAE